MVECTCCTLTTYLHISEVSGFVCMSEPVSTLCTALHQKTQYRIQLWFPSNVNSPEIPHLEFQADHNLNHDLRVPTKVFPSHNAPSHWPRWLCQGKQSVEYCIYAYIVAMQICSIFCYQLCIGVGLHRAPLEGYKMFPSAHCHSS